MSWYNSRNTEMADYYLQHLGVYTDLYSNMATRLFPHREVWRGLQTLHGESTRVNFLLGIIRLMQCGKL